MHILVVDDDIDILELASELFAMSGIQTTTCNTAEEAILVLEEKKFDAMVSDIVMPGLSGIELVKALKSKGKLPKPFVFITGYASENPEAELLLTAGDIDKIFVKPLQFYEVADFLKKAKARLT